MKRLKFVAGGLDGTAKLLGKLSAMKADVETASINALQEAAEFVKRESIERSPVDTHDLEKCHAVKVHHFPTLNKTVAYIFIDDDLMESFHYTPTSKYAIIMHECLQPYGAGPYNLGPLSQAKADAGYDVGGKFLQRALFDNEERVRRIIDKSLKGAIAGAK